MTEGLPPRVTDVFRHLSDLRSGTCGGAVAWPDRVRVFREAVSLLDPVVRRVLEQANAAFLRGGGTINHRVGEDRDGGAYATGSCRGLSSGTPPPATPGALSRCR